MNQASAVKTPGNSHENALEAARLSAAGRAHEPHARHFIAFFV